MIERELKLSVPPRFHPPDLDGVVEGVAAVPLEPLTLRAIYYDTRDLRLIRWGCTLRYRSNEGWTVKLPSTSDSELLARPELRFDGSSRHPPAAALELLRAYSRTEPLEAVARMRTLRRPIELRDETGARVAEVVDDEVSVLDGHRVAERFRELEVELAGGAGGDELLAACVERMRAEGAVVAEPVPKLVRAVGPGALAPPEVDPAPIGESASAGDVVGNAIARSVARFLRHDPGVVLGEDPEDVHQARVALRRLRSDLRTFAPLVDPVWKDHMSGEARWLARLLGDVRDADVLHAALQREAERLPEEEGAALRVLIAQLESARAEARARLLAARREARFVALCEEMVAAARAPALTELAAEPAADALPALVARPWRRLRRAADALDADSPDAALHELRILAKRLRYASEAVAPAAGKRARRLARAAARLQDVLGEHQDATVAQDWLRRAGAEGSPAEAFAAGEAVARQALVAERTRRQWPKTWRRVERAADRGWLRRARRAQREAADGQPEPETVEVAAPDEPEPVEAALPDESAPEPAEVAEPAEPAPEREQDQTESGPDEPLGELAGEGRVDEPPAPREPAQASQDDPVEEPPGGPAGEPVRELPAASGGDVAPGGGL